MEAKKLDTDAIVLLGQVISKALQPIIEALNNLDWDKINREAKKERHRKRYERFIKRHYH